MTNLLPKLATIGDRPCKLARHLALGDWISGGNAGQDVPLLVIATHPYFESDLGDDAIAIVYVRSDGGKPRVVYSERNDEVWLATEAELHPPSPWVAIADELHRIADDLATLTDVGAPSFFAIDIHPGPHRGSDAAVRERVDILSSALLGRPGQDRRMLDGTYHYDSGEGQRGPIKVHVYDAVTEPLEDPMASGREIDNGDQSADVPTGVDGTSVTGRPVSGPPASATGAGR